MADYTLAMPFMPRQLELLAQSCYGNPRLPQDLERMRLEGPGDYDWFKGTGHYPDKVLPPYKLVWREIWHQGDIYPATYVAVPVWCEVIAKFGDRSHAPLLGLLAEIEFSRLRVQPRLTEHLDAETIVAYEVALTGLLPHLPRQLRMLSDTTQKGFRTAESVLALFAYGAGQPWVGAMLREGLPLVDLDGNLTPQMENVARILKRDDLPESLRADYQVWQEQLASLKEEPEPEF